MFISTDSQIINLDGVRQVSKGSFHQGGSQPEELALFIVYEDQTTANYFCNPDTKEEQDRVFNLILKHLEVE